MKIFTNFSTYIWLSCLTIFMAAAFQLAVSDEHILNFLHAVFGIKEVPVKVNIRSGTFLQRLDHFNRTDVHRTFNQKYHFIDEYYECEETEPVVLLVVAAMTQLDENRNYFNNQIYIEFAKRSKALMLLLEPRFYGNSSPFEYLTDDNLKYLNTEQTLADIALFRHRIPNILEENHDIIIPKNAKWVVIGREYGGSLAAWFRLKYPQHAMLAVALDAPLWTKSDFFDYFERVEWSFFYERVLGHVLNGLLALRQKIEEIASSKSSWENRKLALDNIKRDFKLCDDLYTEIDNENLEEPYGLIIDSNIDLMFFIITFELSVIPQIKWLGKETYPLLRDETLVNDYDRVAKTIRYLVDLNEKKCIETNYQKIVDLLKNTEWKNVQNKQYLSKIIRNAFGRRNLFYQKCFEFGRFEAASDESEFFQYIPLSFYKKMCTEVFSPRMDPDNVDAAIFTTNLIYGGTNYAGRKVELFSRRQNPIINYQVKESRKENEMVAIIMTTVPINLKLADDESKKRIKNNYNRIFKTFLTLTGKYKEELEIANEETDEIDIYRDYPDQSENYFNTQQELYRAARRKQLEEAMKKAKKEAANPKKDGEISEEREKEEDAHEGSEHTQTANEEEDYTEG